ncbi:MAG: right-handed parallel beta-helix repeat-containing protein [bacterium]|nr:right-handed parallel beta-helix repeat-containing protein [bacterium]
MSFWLDHCIHTSCLDSTPDSVTEDLWSILDPIPQPNADTPSAFVARGDTVRVKNFAFFNRPEMRQLDWPTRTGGIRNQADLLIVEHCRFDSVSAAIERGEEIRLSNCEFHECLWKCVWTSVTGRLEARNCYFDGESGYAFILAHDSTIIESCVFGCNPSGHFVGLSGNDVQVRGCRFGPCDGNLSTVYVYPRSNCVIEGCDFDGMEDMYMLLEIDVACEETDFPPIVVRDNTFHQFSVRNSAIEMWCVEGTNGYVGMLDDNTFDIGAGIGIPGSSVSVSGSALMRGNRFEEIRPEGTADVYAHTITASGTLTARDNQFLGPGLGAATNGPPFDARWNWWGDSTGPYNASENPKVRERKWAGVCSFSHG